VHLSAICGQVKLDFCDLGRVINGRPGDPVEKKPFERAFTPDKILKSCEKLGLCPVDMRKALTHKRVRDDSNDGDRGKEELSIRQRHAQGLALLAKDGVATSPLLPAESATPVAAPARPTLVDSPSQAELEFQALKKAGTIPGAIFHSVGAKPFNGPLIIKAALERAKEKAAKEGAKNDHASEEFLALQHQAQQLVNWMATEGASFDALTQSERRDLIAYVFKARDETGFTKKTTNASISIEFLESLVPGELDKLLADPPCLHGDGRVAKGLANLQQLPIVVADPLALMTPKTLLSNFGDIEVETGGLSPMVMPPWLQAALVPGSEEADQLVGKKLLYKWPLRLGSWTIGKIASTNKDPNVKVGEKICNFKVFYESDGATADHCLEARGYARNAKSPNDSWVLLGKED
jgi:hypothetical protein